MIDIAALQAPFAAHEHSWRAQTVARDGTRAQALCYITSRAVQNRLDAVCGPHGWESAFDETAAGRVIATIRIDLDGRWVSKSDGAGATAMEGEKGGLSGAFKRAGVMWGIGRYLYELPAIWAECECARDRDQSLVLRNGKPQWRRWSAQGISELERALATVLDRINSTGHERMLPAHRLEPALLPAPSPPPVHLTGAPPFKMPGVVAKLLDGLAVALREGTAEQFWSTGYPSVPEEWRPYVRNEKDRLKREAGLR